MTSSDFRRSMRELCAAGFVTCTRGQPGDDDATYAIGWIPLNDPERYLQDVRERHDRSMRRLGVRHE
jgi:hypothetical protein